MKFFRIVLCALVTAGFAPAAEFRIPDRIQDQIRQVRVSEAGDIAIASGESSDELVHYITENWAALLEHIDDVPDKNG